MAFAVLIISEGFAFSIIFSLIALISQENQLGIRWTNEHIEAKSVKSKHDTKHRMKLISFSAHHQCHNCVFTS